MQKTAIPYWPSSPSNGYMVDDPSRGLFIQRWGSSQDPNYGDIHRSVQSIPKCSLSNGYFYVCFILCFLHPYHMCIYISPIGTTTLILVLMCPSFQHRDSPAS